MIEIENLGKCYPLRPRENYAMLRDRLAHGALAPVRAIRALIDRDACRPAAPKLLWALQDIDLRIDPGEVVGVIGRNGAGKSTLLKILARITHPTIGRVALYGRVGSLLEVGTGFHGELSGRENIFLSGAILGMRRHEIVSRFDQIVAFAEIEQFIDAPVKHYSSGMYLRLAFAVAAHLQPEILLVDEILAVGDLAFQKRCLGKIGQVARDGRTVLFVSHNLPSIEALCSRCLLLRNGRLEGDGRVNDQVLRYMTAELTSDASATALINHGGRRVGSRPIMTAVTLSDQHGAPAAAFRMGGQVTVAVRFRSEEMAFAPVLSVGIKNLQGLSLIRASNRFIGGFDFELRQSSGTISCTFENLPLLPGRYALDLRLGDGLRELDLVDDAISFELMPADVFGTGKLPPRGSAVMFWPASFSFEPDHRLAENAPPPDAVE